MKDPINSELILIYYKECFKILTKELDIRDLRPSETTSLEYAKDILCVRYEIESCVISKLSARPKMKYEVEKDQNIPNQRSKEIIKINRILVIN